MGAPHLLARLADDGCLATTFAYEFLDSEAIGALYPKTARFADPRRQEPHPDAPYDNFLHYIFEHS